MITDSQQVIDTAALALFSAVDLAQTERYLHKDGGRDVIPTRHDIPVYEADPLLGKHPTLLRMMATGVVMDSAILHLHNPTLRRIAISVEIGNVTRNFTIGMKL